MFPGRGAEVLAGLKKLKNNIGADKAVIGRLTRCRRLPRVLSRSVKMGDSFYIPWNGKYLIGTSDLLIRAIWIGSRERCEIDYLTARSECVMPDAKLTRASVLYVAGVRHSLLSKPSAPSITRRHFIHKNA